MTGDNQTSESCLAVYRVRARNTSADSDNKIHDDAVAATYGFRGGLVPGVAVYAYMTVPLASRFGLAWLERGSMQVRFHQPFYEGDEVVVRAEIGGDPAAQQISITAGREDDVACATAFATIGDLTAWLGEPRLEDYPEAALPAFEERPVASRETLEPGSVLGTVREKLDLKDTALLESIDERLPVYTGADAIAHPMTLLALANQSLMQNYRLGPWIHAASDLVNHSAARDGETISARGRIRDCYERKGHEFVVLDLLLVADGHRAVQQVRHTAIYRPRTK
jgi:acyl dehydratase